MERDLKKKTEAFVLALDEDERATSQQAARNVARRVVEARRTGDQFLSRGEFRATFSELRDMMEDLRQQQRAALDLLGRLLSARSQPGDRDVLGPLLRSIAGRLGSNYIFTAREITNDAGFAALLNGRKSAGSLGKLFSRNEGVVIDGLVVLRVTTERNAVLWQIKESLQVST